MGKTARDLAYEQTKQADHLVNSTERKAQGRLARDSSGTCTGLPVRGRVGGRGKASSSMRREEGGEGKHESVAGMERQAGH